MGPPKHRRVVPRVFTDQQLASIAEAPARVHPRTLLGVLAEPLAQLALQFVPQDIAPNLLSLCALLCCVHAYYITAVYGDAYPRVVYVTAGTQLVAFHLVSMCVGRHAAQLKTWSPLDDIFHTITSSIAVTFVVYVFAYQVGLQAPLDQWYCVQLAYGVVLWERLSLLVAGKKSMLGWFRIWQGVEEPIAVVNAIVGWKLVFGFDPLKQMWSNLVLQSLPYMETILSPMRVVSAATGTLPVMTMEQAAADPVKVVTTLVIPAIYFALIGLLLLRSLLIVVFNGEHKFTGCLLLIVLPCTCSTWLFTAIGLRTLTVEDVLCDGIWMAVLTSDLVIARLASRQLNEWILVLGVVGLVQRFAPVLVCLVYLGTVIYEVAMHLNAPLFTVVTNVYIDGVFDLCHLGHKKHIMRALEYGNRVYVGVMKDSDVEKYKREPMMTTEERCNEVASLRCVYQVIKGAPCFGMTEEFIQKYNLHVILCSPEYDKPDDKYYAVPRRLGMLKIMPRTHGISTSEIITRIREH